METATKLLQQSFQLYKQKQYHAAEDLSRQALKKKAVKPKQQATAYYLLALCELEAKHYLESFDLTKKSLKLDPQNFLILHLLGLHYVSLGERKTAEKCFRKAIQINNQYPPAWLNLTACKQFNDASDSDIKCVLQLLDQAKASNNEPKQSTLSFSLGKIYDDLNDYQQAIEYYFQANFLSRRAFRVAGKYLL